MGAISWLGLLLSHHHHFAEFHEVMIGADEDVEEHGIFAGDDCFDLAELLALDGSGKFVVLDDDPVTAREGKSGLIAGGDLIVLETADDHFAVTVPGRDLSLPGQRHTVAMFRLLEPERA